MAILKVRSKIIKQCVQKFVEDIRKKTERNFNSYQHHKSGRSGNHGKKFNIISTTIARIKNDNLSLNETGCFENQEEKNLVTSELSKFARQFQLKGSSVNHLYK